MSNFLKITDLNYLNVFEKFSITIEEKKLTSISGPNNCGKTTLLRILDKQIPVDSSIEINHKKQNEYKLIDYNKTLKVLIPGEFTPIFYNVEEEIEYAIDQLFLSKEEKNKRLRDIYKYLNITKIKKEAITNLNDSDIVKLQIAVAIASMPKMIMIDDISTYFTNEEVTKLIEYFKKLITNYGLTIVIISTRLEDLIKTDYLYIIQDSKILLQGIPIEVLQKDNILNKIGMRVPFMIDLSVKLKDYDLIKDIELDMSRMANTLWK